MKKFGLSACERIKSKKEFELVYSAGNKITSSGKLLKAQFYLEEGESDTPVKVAFGIYKKSGKAYWRNRIRRILKECYRLNKADLIRSARIHRKKMLVVFSINIINQKSHKKTALNEIVPDFIDLLFQINSKIVE